MNVRSDEVLAHHAYEYVGVGRTTTTLPGTENGSELFWFSDGLALCVPIPPSVPRTYPSSLGVQRLPPPAERVSYQPS